MRYALLIAFVWLALPAATTEAADYPTKPIRLIVPLSPGGGTDIFARMLGQRLAERWGQQIVVDNRAGASGMVGSDIVAKAAPDGYTLVMVSSTHTMLPSLEPKMPFDPLRDFAAVTQATAQPYVLGVHPAIAALSVREFIALAKAKPGQLNYSSGGNGSAPHIGTELLKSMAGIDLVHVAYKGGAPAILALAGGEVAISFGSLPSTLPLVRAGKIRALAVSSLKRTPAAPDLPTIAEAGVPGFEIINWYGMLAPAKTPAHVIDKLYAAIAQTLQSAHVRERLLKDGTDIVASTPAEFTVYIRNDIAKWIKVVKTAGIRVE
jgi:tripartite-type tricarboxylate transporter receptor subunit TctC